jgi:hypothetical protein
MARHSFWNTQLSIQQTSYSTTTSATPSSNHETTSDKNSTNASHDRHVQDPTVITNKERESNNIENSKTSPTTPVDIVNTSSSSANHGHPAAEEHEPTAPKTIHPPPPLKPRQNKSTELYWSPAKELLQSFVKPQSSKKRPPPASTRPVGQPKSGSNVNLATTQHIILKQSGHESLQKTKTVSNTHLFPSMMNSSSDEPQLDEDVKTYNQSMESMRQAYAVAFSPRIGAAEKINGDDADHQEYIPFGPVRIHAGTGDLSLNPHKQNDSDKAFLSWSPPSSLDMLAATASTTPASLISMLYRLDLGVLSLLDLMKLYSLLKCWPVGGGAPPPPPALAIENGEKNAQHDHYYHQKQQKGLLDLEICNLVLRHLLDEWVDGKCFVLVVSSFLFLSCSIYV